MRKTKKELKGWKKELVEVVIVIVSTAIICMLAYGIKYIYMRCVYGDRHIETFPFEKLNDLPDEPDWKNENAFDNRLYDQMQGKELIDWIESLDEKTGIINKSCDPMPLRKLIPRFGTPYGPTLYNNNGNLVVIYDTLGYELKRIEFFSTTEVQGDYKYVATEETIIDDLNSYIDYQNNNTLYYYVNDGMYKVLPIEEGVEQLQGMCLYRTFTKFPILQKDGIIYTYILEDSEGCMYDYMYRTEAIRVKKIVISDLKVECEVETERGNKDFTIILDDGLNHLYIVVKFKKDVEIQDGTYNLQEIMPILLQEEAFFVEKEFRKTNWCIKKTDSYDNDELY